VIKKRLFRTVIPLLAAAVALTAVLSALFGNQANHQPLTGRPAAVESPAPAAAPIALGKPLPAADLLAQTGQEALYATEDGFRSILSAVPTHYQDPAGRWQPINPAFVASAGEFSVAANSLTSRSGRHRAWVAAGAEDPATGQALAVNWQATGLAAAGPGGLVSLAEPLAEGEGPAAQRDDSGRLLRYEDGWSDPAVAEWLVSEAGSLEHLLVLDERPDAPGSSQALVMSAELKLSPGAELWADGQKQTGPFSTNGHLEIRQPDQESGLALAPILAYEVDDMTDAVAGEYVLRPGGEPGTWLVEVRTPWSWWADPDRAYPAAIDPRITVMRTTGALGSGTVYISNKPNLPWVANGTMTLGPTYAHDELTRGYVQFNTMPALLTNNQPMVISQATLRVAANGYSAPDHGYCFPSFQCSPGEEYTNQLFLFSNGFQMNTELHYLGSCPGDPGCNGLDLENPNYSTGWPGPEGALVDKRPLVIPKATQKGELSAWAAGEHGVFRQVHGELSYAEFDVTDQIQSWYNALYGPSGPTGGRPAFMLRLDPSIVCPPGPYADNNELAAKKCAALHIASENVQLIIDYQQLELPAGQTLTNTLGAPSYNPGVFGAPEVVNGDWQTTNHLYELSDPGGTRWRAVAARGDHLEIPAADSGIGLQLWQYPLSDNSAADQPLAESSLDPYFTHVLFVDERHAPGGTADLRAAVEAAAPERDAMDTDANYRIQHLPAANYNVPYSAVTTISSNIASDELVSLWEFALTNQDNVKISVTIPPTAPVRIVLIPPTAGSDNFVVQDGKQLDGQNGKLSFNDTVFQDGTYALAIINQDRPSYHPPPDPVPVSYPFEVRITRCDRYSIPTDRFLGPPTNLACQPIPLPLHGAGLQSSHMRYVRIDQNPDKWLLVHHLGGFIENPGDDVWCTTSEHMGAPVIAQLSPVMAPGLYTGDWVVVGQGSVCLANGGGTLPDGNYFGTLRTTDLAAVGLATLEGSPNLPVRRGVLRKFMFGKTDFPIDPAAHGETYVTSGGDFIAQNDNTWTAFDPFRQYWAANTLELVPPAISTNLMAFLGSALVSTDVIIDFDQPPAAAQWDIPWQVDPRPDPVPEGEPNYTFSHLTAQVTPLPAVSTFSGLELRIQPTGFEGWLTDMDWTAYGGPNVLLFRANDSRVTGKPELGAASKVNIAIVTPPGRKRVPAGEQACRFNNVPISCLDLRDPAAFDFDIIFGEVTIAPWKLPDLQITGQTGTLLFSGPGQFEAFSTDHPDSQGPDNVSLPFSFDTWGGEVTISEGPCGGGGPVVTLVKGTGYIALPMIGGEGSYPGQNPISMTYTMCETELHEVIIQFVPPTPVPVASTGLEVTLLKGTVIVGPDSTRITLQVNFQSVDDGATLSDGVGTITLDTAGLLAIDAKGDLVSVFDADFQLNVAWNPLDLLLQGDVRYLGGNLITGWLYLHAWRGSGWQNKYYWIDDNNLHFAGQIGGQVGIPEGELISKGFFKIPPFSISKSADISFGEFCNNPDCSTYEWGVAATVSVFGYKAGVYVDDSGPEIILGSKGKKLIDQAGGGSIVVPPRRPDGGVVIVTPGLEQLYTFPDWASQLDGLTSDHAGCVSALNGTRYTCPFTVAAGTGRAQFTATWLNGDLDVSLIDPNNVIYTGSNPGAGIVYSETVESGTHFAIFSVSGTSAAGTIPQGTWRLRLDNIIPDYVPGPKNNWSMLFAADPPVPTLEVLSPAGPGIPAGSSYNITWDAGRGGLPLESNVDLELFYAPAFSPEPLPSSNLLVTFPGDYMEQIGGINWDPSDTTVQGNDFNADGVYRFTTGLSDGEYAFKVAIDGSWAENYGQYGLANGANISFTAPAGGGPVHFYYDRRDNFITTRPDSDIPVLVGDMMNELGGVDWEPANLVGWLKPGDEELHVLVLNLPAGDWEYKVALNESWDINYGQNGIPNGPNIPLSVPVDGTAVRFTYDSVSHIISHTILSEPGGIPISVTLDANTGSYLWDTGGLASGEYLVGGRLNDIQRGNGVIIDWAPGTIVINDTTPPPVPTGVALHHYQGGNLMASWDSDLTTPDLAGYLIQYWIPGPTYDVDADDRVFHSLRVSPSPNGWWWFNREWAHLTGILDATLNPYNATAVCVRAYDASGNLSGCTAVPLTFPLPLDVPLDVPEVFEVVPNSGQFFQLFWTEPPIAAGYVLRYGPAGCQVPGAVTIADEGPSPIILIPPQFDFELLGLTPNQLYWFELAAIDHNLMPGKPIRVERMLIDGPDGNGDGLPDEWADFYGITNPLGDLDQDGLDELTEYQLLSNPWHADSDGDGFYDSVELEWGTDVCGPEKPPYHTRPLLTLFGNQHYNMRTATNQAPVEDTLQIVNFGGGEMDWQVAADASWLTFDQTSGSGDATVTFTANPAGLPPGAYNATITIVAVPPTGLSGGGLQETAEVEVTFVVMPEIGEPDTTRSIFLPLVFR
jgi:hypothetical protein